MDESFFEIEVRCPNKIFVVYGKPVRSPFKLTVGKEEAKHIITSIKSLGLLDYSIVEVETKLRTNIESIILDKSKKEDEKLKDISLENVIEIIKSFKSSEDIKNKINDVIK